MQLIHLIPQKWKNNMSNNRIFENILFLNHHLIKCNILLSLEILNSKELYWIQLTHDFCKPTSQIYFEKHFNDCILDWKYIYVLPHIVTSDPYTRYFQYKVLNNVLYLNEKLFFFGISETSQCSFCSQNKPFFWKPSFFVRLDATDCFFRIHRKGFRRYYITESFTIGV